MLNPKMPPMPGVGAVTDTLDFVKNLWGSMSVPGINFGGLAVPTMSVDELDKKIADLKAVESWLNLNVTMVRGTIQALEVQRGTIATLKSMGATLAQAVRQPGADEKSVLAAAPFAKAFFAEPAPAPAQAPEAKPAEPAGAADKPAASPFMPDPAAWWNMLQSQFNEAVGKAMSKEAAPPPAPAKAASKPAAKPKNGNGKPKAAKS